jgi:hypothetical protein
MPSFITTISSSSGAVFFMIRAFTGKSEFFNLASSEKDVEGRN